MDLLSVFSDTATPDIKSHYAFRIFGKEQGVGWNTSLSDVVFVEMPEGSGSHELGAHPDHLLLGFLCLLSRL